MLNPNYGPKQFTTDEVKIIHDAAHAVWNEVAGDYLELTEGKPIKRAEVVEVVCDASRLEQQVRRKHPELAEKISNASNLEKVVTPAFKYRTYA
jgi:hypothetical protein